MVRFDDGFGGDVRLVFRLEAAKQMGLFGDAAQPRTTHVKAHTAQRSGKLVQVAAHDRELKPGQAPAKVAPKDDGKLRRMAEEAVNAAELRVGLQTAKESKQVRSQLRSIAKNHLAQLEEHGFRDLARRMKGVLSQLDRLDQDAATHLRHAPGGADPKLQEQARKAHKVWRELIRAENELMAPADADQDPGAERRAKVDRLNAQFDAFSSLAQRLAMDLDLTPTEIHESASSIEAEHRYQHQVGRDTSFWYTRLKEHVQRIENHPDADEITKRSVRMMHDRARERETSSMEKATTTRFVVRSSMLRVMAKGSPLPVLAGAGAGPRPVKALEPARLVRGSVRRDRSGNVCQATMKLGQYTGTYTSNGPIGVLSIEGLAMGVPYHMVVGRFDGAMAVMENAVAVFEAGKLPEEGVFATTGHATPKWGVTR